MSNYNCPTCHQFPDECNCGAVRKRWKEERTQDVQATFQGEVEQYISTLKSKFDVLEKLRLGGVFGLLERGQQQAIQDTYHDLRAIVSNCFFKPADIKQHPAYKQGQADMLAQLNAWTQEQIRKAQK